LNRGHNLVAARLDLPAREGVVSIEIRAAKEIMAAWTAQLTFLIVKFVAAAGTPAPVFALNLTRIGALNRRVIRQRERLSIQVGGHSTLFVWAAAKFKQGDRAAPHITLW
jgi:hypothetical protein